MQGTSAVRVALAIAGLLVLGLIVRFAGGSMMTAIRNAHHMH